MNPIHRAFDKLYPAIRFVYERVQGHAWFDQITSQIWMGGAPTYPRDYEYLLETGINAVVDVREEREDDQVLFTENEIDYLKLKVLDVMVPSDQQLDAGTVFIDEHVKKGGKVLIHCAKGRGRSAAMLAAYLMRYEGLSYDEARALMLSKRSLVNLQGRHQKALERWIKKYQVQQNSILIEP